jgi:hypothetical protein
MAKSGYRLEAATAWKLVEESWKQLDGDDRGWSAYVGDVKAAPGLIANHGLIVSLCYLAGRSYGGAEGLLAEQLALVAAKSLPGSEQKSTREVVGDLANTESRDLVRASRVVMEYLRWMRMFVGLQGAGDHSARGTR